MGSVSYTREQEQCIGRLVGPVDISAGAGSGKTFTLSQRIAYALSPDSNSGIRDIDEVLAITFTDKAASEIKSRVRSTLRGSGLFDPALKVDSAWISTIHGMCSRILRAHALALGLDPGFSVIGDKERQEMLDASINEVIGGDSEIVSRTEFDALFEAFPARSAGFGGGSIASMVEGLIAKAAGMVEGFDGFRTGPDLASPSVLAKRLLLAYEDMLDAYEGAKATASLEKNRANALAAAEALQDYLVSGSGSLDEFIGVLDACEYLGTRGCPAEETEAYRSVHASVAQEAYLAKAKPLLDDLLSLARRVQDVFEARKRAAGVLDNDDLLKHALDALSREDVAAEYRDRFKLVMVDEFQDTSQLQIEIVRHLAGEGLRYLCTVGDAQQSIYRFRGADVNVYKAFRAGLETDEVRAHGGDPMLLKLSRNFRSHADVLAFVRAVCSQKRVFGDDFLDLEAAYDGRGYRSSEPRVQLVAATVGQGCAGGSAELAEAEARAIAQYFRRMHEAGHALSDMAVLLGRMAYAEVYARAIRDEGFACVIAGGSLFHKAHEVKTVERLLRALADLNDTQALFEVLTSDMFEISADEMLELATGFDEANGIPIKRDLSKGFAALAERADELPAGLAHAVSLLRKAQLEIRYKMPSAALMDVLLDSGWIARLEGAGAEGSARIANVLKAVRFVESMERDKGYGIARCAAEFSSLIVTGMKEAPGALSADGQEAVRIMTIHASKGLEFPIVALARFAKGQAGPSGKLVAETIGSETYLSLAPPSSLIEKGSLSAKAYGKPYEVSDEADPRTATTLADYHASLKCAAHREEQAEEQRLFYVGATRAKEALAVVMGIKEQKTDPFKAYKGSVDDIRSALCGSELFPLGEALLEYGGSEPASFTRVAVFEGEIEEHAGDEDGAAAGVGRGETRLDAEASPDASPSGNACACDPVGAEPPCQQIERSEAIGTLGTIAVPKVEPFGLLDTRVPAHEHTGLFSYSSIAEPHDAVAFDGARDAAVLAADADKATDLGSAFHRLAQLAALRSPDFAWSRFDAVAKTYGIKDAERLRRAVERWFSSGVCTRALGMRVHDAEVPFCVAVADAGCLEGEIDLFCADDERHAFIVDYKTGGSAEETDEQLHEKHLLQAQCYAYATLRQGYDSVEFAFVRVERDDPAGADTLQAVPYRFEQGEIDDLEALIAARASASAEPIEE